MYDAAANLFVLLTSGTLKRLQKEGKLGELKTIVIVVCGGLSVNLELLEKWKKQTGIEH